MPHLTFAELDSDSKPVDTMVVELTDEQIGRLKIGQKVDVRIKGSVGMLEIPPEGTSEKAPAIMGIRVESKTVRGMNVFEELSEDEED